MKKSKVIMLGGIVGVVVLILIILLDPLKKPSEKIRESILKETPIGTSMEDVLIVVGKEKKWEIFNINYDYGFSRPDTREKIGEKSIRVSIGEYSYIIGSTSVDVFWGFDENGELIDVYVWKVANSV